MKSCLHLAGRPVKAPEPEAESDRKTPVQPPPKGELATRQTTTKHK